MRIPNDPRHLCRATSDGKAGANPMTFASSFLVVGLGLEEHADMEEAESMPINAEQDGHPCSPRILTIVATISTELHISLLSLNGSQGVVLPFFVLQPSSEPGLRWFPSFRNIAVLRATK